MHEIIEEKTVHLNHKQLTLAIQPNDKATLANFNWGNNALLEEQLRSMLSFQGDRILYLFGLPGSGKSHLLQACCQALPSSQASMYLPLKLLKEWGASSLENLEDQTLICVDDAQIIANHAVWEEALFHLFNKVKDNENGLLIISGNVPPANLPLQLPDLRSRLGWGLVMQLHELADEEKMLVLQQHARRRGFELPLGVAQFLLNRCSRNMHYLHALLQKLDEASLAEHRKITIPFVKNLFSL